MRKNEYGKLCQACFLRTESRIYPRQCLSRRGKDAKEYKWRRLCKTCWQMADEGKL